MIRRRPNLLLTTLSKRQVLTTDHNSLLLSLISSEVSLTIINANNGRGMITRIKGLNRIRRLRILTLLIMNNLHNNTNSVLNNSATHKRQNNNTIKHNGRALILRAFGGLLIDRNLINRKVPLSERAQTDTTKHGNYGSW